MQDQDLKHCTMIPNLFDYKSYYISGHETYGDPGLYEDPHSSSHDGYCSDSLYLTYKDNDDWSQYTNREVAYLGYREKETPHNSSRTWFGDCSSYLGSYWGENGACQAYQSSMQTEDDALYQGDKCWNYFSDSNNKPQDYLENQGHGYSGFCLGGDKWDGIFCNLENLNSSRSWDDWELEETIVYERIFGR